jgi:uncharacterized protein (TIGR02001 family)
MQLKKGLTALAAVALVSTLGVATARADGPEVAGDMGVFSQYVWRAVSQTAGAAAVQGDLSASMGGVTGAVWFSNAYPASNGRDVVEFDWTLDYSGSAGPAGYSVGAIYYTYLYDGHSNFTELYAGGSYDGPLAPSLTVYYTVTDVDSGFYKNGDIWIDLGVGGSALGADFSGTLSYVAWKSDPGRTADLYEDGLAAIALGVSKDMAVDGMTLTPSVTITVPLVSDSSDGNQYIYGTMVEPEFIAGLNLAY